MEVKLLVDGRKIPLNDFVEKIMAGTIKGAVESLRDVEKDWKKIVLEVSQ